MSACYALDRGGAIMGGSLRSHMVLFVVIAAFAFLLGLALRGSPRGFEAVRLRAWSLVVIGLGLQFLPLPNGAAGRDLAVRIVVLGASYVLLIAFALLNRRLPGMPLMLVGLLLNAAVILPNGGMPVSEAAIHASGQGDMLRLFVEEGATKHHLMTEEDVLRPLGDVIGVPPPIRQVVSVGDVLIYVGIVWFVLAVMRGGGRSAGPEATGRYRGKHRPGSRAETALPAGATRPQLPR